MNMKKIRLTCLVWVLCSVFTLNAQVKVEPQFHEGVELMSMVWRLMGAHEYNLCMVPKIYEEADRFFAPMKNHKVVELAKEMRKSNVAYDAVADYGLHLNISEKGKITFKKDIASGSDDSFDRWSEKGKKEMLAALNDFYKKSRFHEWYLSTESLRQEALAAFEKNGSQIDYSWFDRFFGPLDHASFHIVLSFLVGTHNYGCSMKATDGTELLTPVIGNIHQDEGGSLFYNDIRDIIVHEFCHAYCNPLNAKFWDAMAVNAQAVFEEKAEALASIAYGNAMIMMNETFVRSSVIRYLLTHDRNAHPQKLIKAEEDLGFLLTATLVGALEKREQQKDQYATMTDFMPEYVKAVNSFSVENYKKEQEEYAKHSPKVLSTSIDNGAKDISSGEVTFSLTFDKPMNVNQVGLNIYQGYSFPTLAKKEPVLQWSEDKKTLQVYLNLASGKEYGLMIPAGGFSSADGYINQEDIPIKFTTK